MKTIRFKLGHWNFITPIDEMQEIVQHFEVHPLPLTKPWLAGVCHLRGIIFPVTDLWYFVTLKSYAKGDNKKDSLLLFSQGDWQFGLRVSDLRGMIDVETTKINGNFQYPYELTRISSCLGGVAVFEDENYYLFHPRKLTDLPEFMSSFDINK